jgi:chitinase
VQLHRCFFARSTVWLLAGLALVALMPLTQAQTDGDDTQSAAAQNPLPKRLVADYIGGNSAYTSAQIPFSKITTVNHSGFGINLDGSLAVPDGLLEPELLSRAHEAGVKVLVLLGGDFSTVAADLGTRATLVSSLSEFIKDDHYDGVDIDWEFPASLADRENFVELTQELRQFLPSPRFLISVDVGPWGGGDTPFQQLTRMIDYFNIMMYDCAGPWTADTQFNSAIFWDPKDPDPSECQPGGSADGATDIFLNYLHVPPSQLNMGTPFYGYFYKPVKGLWTDCPGANPNTNTDCGDNAVFPESYGTYIKQRVNNYGWVRHYDKTALVPYLLRADGGRGFITYDDYFSTYTRVRYSVWDRGLGGTFMWSVDQDYDGHSQDLLDAMYQAIVDGAN